MSPCRTAEEALAFVQAQGVVLVSAKGDAPRLTEAILGDTIKGSWWAHPQGRRIYTVLGTVTGSDQVLVCRLIQGKLTLVHRRLWPALVRIAGRFAPGQLAQVREEHTPSGRHVTTDVPFPQWLPAGMAELAGAVDEAEALACFAPWLEPAGQPSQARP